MKKVLSIVTLLLMTQISFAIGGASSISKLIFEEGLEAILKQDSQLVGSVASIQNDLARMASTLTGKQTPSGDDIVKAVRDLNTSSAEDGKLKEELLVLLSKDNPTPEDIVAAKDKMIILSRNLGRFDDTTFIACNGACATSGARLANPTNEAVVAIARTIPAEIDAQERMIASSLRTLNIERPRNWKRLVGENNFKALATFLKMASPGAQISAAQREFINAIMEFSKEGDVIKLIDEDNLHFFYRTLVTGDYSDDELISFANLLKRAKTESPSTTGRKEAFYKILDSYTANSPSKKQALEKLREQNCFFK